MVFLFQKEYFSFYSKHPVKLLLPEEMRGAS